MSKNIPASAKVVVIGGGVAGMLCGLPFIKIWLERYCFT